MSWLATRGSAIRLAWSSSEDRLGLRTPPVALPDVLAVPAKVVQVAAGEAHVLFLAVGPEPRVFSSGANDFGQLGIGDTLPHRDGPKFWEVPGLSADSLVGSVAAGGHVSFAISQRGDVWSWGQNQEAGVLGLGDIPVTSVASPTPVASLRRRVRAVQAATNGRTAFSISHLGTLYSWGAGTCGCHGHGHQYDEAAPKVLQGFGATPVVQVAAGLLHALALGASCEVYAWGRTAGAFGSEAQLQLAPKVIDKLAGVRIVQVAAGGEHSLALSDAGEVYGWGAHAGGELSGKPAIEDEAVPYAMVHRLDLGIGKVREIGCGHFHSLFLLAGPAGGEEGREKGKDLWICGQAAPPPGGPNKPSPPEGWAQQSALPQKPAGMPMRLTCVDVKRVLELMA